MLYPSLPPAPSSSSSSSSSCISHPPPLAVVVPESLPIHVTNVLAVKRDPDLERPRLYTPTHFVNLIHASSCFPRPPLSTSTTPTATPTTTAPSFYQIFIKQTRKRGSTGREGWRVRMSGRRGD
ncbi:hypothetical protein E2C01_040332 [Portunus trituberculatus]|uniref:Uncharacterized protein n=1 Tax=Portunus trituberculatus TaxID=210409 RepID=A0A5B7FN16_PORTR|nr:hypothetical protein [Portunus trituberculatus]